MTNNERWEEHVAALSRYVARTGNARVQSTHVETTGGGGTINLGAWVTYVRQRYRAGHLSVERAQQLSAFEGWEWGPLQPGPAPDAIRNTEILALRSSGASLQKIGDRYGLSRQRIHQIVRLEGSAR
jgi:hypothetical protein